MPDILVQPADSRNDLIFGGSRDEGESVNGIEMKLGLGRAEERKDGETGRERCAYGLAIHASRACQRLRGASAGCL